MPEEQFSDYVARERDRLGAERKAVVTQQRELQAKLAEIDREFQAIYQTKRVSCLYPADAAQRPHSRRRAAFAVLASVLATHRQKFQTEDDPSR